MTTRLIDHGWRQRTFPGETICGDQAAIIPGVGGWWLVVADGLGHGPRAHAAATKAVAMVEHVAKSGARLVDVPAGSLLTASRISLRALFANIHDRLRETVGATLGVAHIDPQTGVVHAAGVGNIIIRRLGSADTTVVCRAGFLGQPGRRPGGPQPVELQLAPRDLLLLASDGLVGSFGPGEYPGLLTQPAAQVAQTLVEQFANPHDDVTCLALRYTP